MVETRLCRFGSGLCALGLRRGDSGGGRPGAGAGGVRAGGRSAARRVGALMAALVPPSLQPLFPGANELDQISRIHDVMGSPPEKTLTKFKQ